MNAWENLKGGIGRLVAALSWGYEDTKTGSLRLPVFVECGYILQRLSHCFDPHFGHFFVTSRRGMNAVPHPIGQRRGLRIFGQLIEQILERQPYGRDIPGPVCAPLRPFDRIVDASAGSF